MKNLHPQCEHPAIILNPHLKDLILHYGNYYINGQRRQCGIHWYDEFPYSMFGKIKRSVSIDEFEKYYILDSDGEHLPLFLAVPCGRCVLCTEKKANEWVTRAMCESQTSISPPIFFTLTYNDYCLPWNGVRKGAMQRFMKRLRINVDRYCGFKSNIRYFICSEYGTKTKRPHYHGILWNLPLLQPEHVDDIIDKSWSFAVSKKFYDSVPERFDKFGKPLYKYYEPTKKQYRVKYGYTRSSICTEGRVRYAMKYMRKEAEIPFGKHGIFFLSSRKGGIGSSWIESKIDEYRNNPQLLDVVLTDVWSGVQWCGCLPRYFKDKIAPPLSKIISKDIRDTFKQWNYFSNVAHSLIAYNYTPNPRGLLHYPSLYYHSSRIPNIVNFTARYVRHDEEYQQKCRDTFKIVDFLERKLLSYEYDIKLSLDVPIYKKAHLEFVERFINGQTQQPSLFDKVSSVRRRRLRSRLREVF